MVRRKNPNQNQNQDQNEIKLSLTGSHVRGAGGFKAEVEGAERPDGLVAVVLDADIN